MNPVTVTVGAAAILFGLYMAFLRITNPAKLGKLEPMKERFGTAGAAIHFIAYSVVPVAYGIVTILGGLKGDPLF